MMEPNPYKHISLNLAIGGLLTIGLVMIGGFKIAHADPENLFVNSTGTGTACAQAAPCNLQTALAEATNGDSIYLAGGTYIGTGNAVITLNKSISLFGGWDGGTNTPPVLNPQLYPTTLDGENTRLVIDISGNITVTVDGFIITRGKGAFSGGGIKAEGASSIIRNNQIFGNLSGGDGGAIFINRGSAQILNNQIVDNKATWAGGLRIINDADATIMGNEILSNTAQIGGGGIDLGCCGKTTPLIVKNIIAHNNGGNWGGGVSVDSTNVRLVNNFLIHNQALSGATVWLRGMDSSYLVNATLINNTLVNNKTGGEAVEVDTYVNATIVNNIISSHATGITKTIPTSSTVSADHNLFWDNNDDGFQGTHWVDDDPAFVDPNSKDYHISSNSAAIDAGIDAGVTDDFDGDPRDASPDIGADEYPAPLPDLTGEWISESVTRKCKTSKGVQKCKISGTFTVRNTGNTDATSASLKFYLSEDAVYDAGDALLKLTTTRPLKKGTSKATKLKANLEPGVNGAGKYVIAVIDEEGGVAELNEGNNRVAYPIP